MQGWTIKEELAVQMRSPAWDRDRGERLWGPDEGRGMGMERGEELRVISEAGTLGLGDWLCGR